MCQEIIPRINGSHKKKTKPCTTHAIHAVNWKITKLFIRNINLLAINWSVVLCPVSIFIWFVYIIFRCTGGAGKKSKMEWVTFDSNASSIQVSKAGRQTAISLQQHLPNKTLTFPLNSDTKRMYKMSNQRIIKECHYNYQSLKASR